MLRMELIKDRAPRTDVTGRMFAYKSNCFRSATMGDEYPTTLREGELRTTCELTEIRIPELNHRT
jgi:hypothetical protein